MVTDMKDDRQTTKEVVTTVIRLGFDCNSSALRPFDDVRHDQSAALRPK